MIKSPFLVCPVLKRALNLASLKKQFKKKEIFKTRGTLEYEVYI